MIELSAKSRANMRGLHPDLVRVITKAALLSSIPFEVTEGLRTLARQRQLKASGASKTLNSRHLTGHAVDIVPAVDVTGDGKVTAADMWHHSQLVKLSPTIKAAFKAEGVAYEWGGDWPNAWDKPHWQLPWSKYPIRTASLGGLDPELMEALSEVEEDARMESPLITPRRGFNLAAGTGMAGGAGMVSDAAYQLQEAQGHINSGTIFGLVIGLMIVAASALAIYAKWDEAGRPGPVWLKRWLK